MPKPVRLILALICVGSVLLQGCGGVRLATLGENIDGIKKSGQTRLEKECEQHPYTSIEYQNCRQQVRRMYEELDSKQKADAQSRKQMTPQAAVAP